MWGGGAAAYFYYSSEQARRVGFRTAKLVRGDLRATIRATGTIEPEEVVDVGVQIAGEVREFGPDPRDPSKPVSYGSPVEAGTVLGRLDDALYQAREAQARAALAKAEADVLNTEAKLRQAERDLNRNRDLQARRNGFVSQKEIDQAESDHDIARASLAVARSGVDVARANLKEASVNLGYTTIRSPVKGVVLDRRVNIGQTVVASLNAPSVFLIAKDLSRMQIWVSVNEADVGAIHPGQGVQFQVAAFPEARFRGTVEQVRLNASMIQSVVTYTVVVNFDNAGGKLLPYLTARVDFEVDERKNVLSVPNAALRWRPRPDWIAVEARASESQRQAVATRGGPGTLWVRSGEFVRPIRVQTGLTDGSATEVSGDSLRQGLEVVVGSVREDDPDQAVSILPHTRTKKEADPPTSP